MRGIAQLCYNASLQVFYYLGPNDYMVKEIDAVTGEITAKFGRRPNRFVALPERYHDIGRGSLDDLKQLNMNLTTVESMTLVEDRFLFVSYNHPDTIMSEWVVYMINPFGPFNVVASGRLEPFSDSDHDSVPIEAITAEKESIYVWRPPRRQVADKSIGTLEKYTVTLDLN